MHGPKEEKNPDKEAPRKAPKGEKEMRRKTRFARVHVVFSIPRRSYPTLIQLLELVEEKTRGKVVKVWEG